MTLYTALLRNFMQVSLVLVATVPLFAAEPIVQPLPVGTLLPLMLSTDLNSDKSKPGEKISAKLKQDVSLPDRGLVKSGAEVLGHVVSVKRGSPASVVVIFDQLRSNGRQYPITTNLRALASMAAIFQAKQPINGNAQDGVSVWEWNTRQIGGDIVFGGQRKVESTVGVVGMAPEPGWVVGVPRGNPENGCAAPDNKNLQAFWLFSTDACGVYGEEGLRILRGPEDKGSGKISLVDAKKVLVRGGSGLLLSVEPQKSPGVQAQ